MIVLGARSRLLVVAVGLTLTGCGGITVETAAWRSNWYDGYGAGPFYSGSRPVLADETAPLGLDYGDPFQPDAMGNDFGGGFGVGFGDDFGDDLGGID